MDFAEDCKIDLQGDRVPRANWLLLGIICFWAAIFYWASIAELDEVTRGSGKVIPSQSIQMIQSLEGGILSEAYVKEGDQVQSGQVLLQIDDTQFQSTFKETLARKDVLEARISRLTTESKNGAQLAFSQRLNDQRPDLIKREVELFRARNKALQELDSVLMRKLNLAQKEWKLTAPAVERGVVSRLEQIRLDREINDIRGEIETNRLEFKKRAHEEKDEAQAELETLVQTLTGSEDRVRRTVVRSPVSGTINKTHIKTIGAVIGPGADIMEIVPSDDTLLIEADVKPSDIAFLNPSLEAMVKITAYDFAVYGGLKGKVEQISADTILDPDGNPFYQIMVRTDSDELIHQDETLPIIPGMVAEVDILTGRRTVLQYLLKPFNRAKGRALKER